MKKAVITVICFLFVSVITVTSVFASVNKINYAKSLVDKDKPLIVIDAGHGGFDGGCVGADGTFEKDVNLAISLQLNQTLNQAGFKTLLIRDTDCSVETEGTTIRAKKKSDIFNRFSYMNDYSGCVYLSIHQNQYSAASVNGGQMFYTPNNDNSRALAESLQKNIIDYVQHDNKRKVKPCTKDVYIIHNAPKESTAVLVECGFLSNKTDLYNLKNPDYQKRFCFAVTAGILDWLELTED